MNGECANRTECTYGLKTNKPESQVNDLNAFVEDLVKIADNIEYRAVRDQFLNKLSSDTKRINRSSNVMAFADKTRNIYEMKPDQYNKLLHENVTATYKLANEQALEKVNQVAKNIASDLNVDDRMETMAKSEAFITVKGHKDNFNNNSKCHLINPAKPQIGRVNKSILDRINSDI